MLNQPPADAGQANQLNVEARGRLESPDEFGDVVVKTDDQGRVTRIRDVGHVEVGAADYGNTAYMARQASSTLLI